MVLLLLLVIVTAGTCTGDADADVAQAINSIGILRLRLLKGNTGLRIYYSVQAPPYKSRMGFVSVTHLSKLTATAYTQQLLSLFLAWTLSLNY